MKLRKSSLGVLWVLGTIQYGAALFGGGALWLLAAWATGGFGGDLAAQAVALGLLLALIAAEAWWARLPDPRHPRRAFLLDFLSSAAIAAFGMAVVVAIAFALRR